MIRNVTSYQSDIAAVQANLSVFDPPMRGKTVLLKPNLVGLDPLHVINAHPTVIAATRECLLRMGAAKVLIGDGPALERDTEAVLESIRMRDFSGPFSVVR